MDNGDDASSEVPEKTSGKVPDDRAKSRSKKKKKITFIQVDDSDKELKENVDEEQFLSFGFCMLSDVPTNLNLCNMILLDSESTMDLFCNHALVSKVWKAKGTLTVHGNGGNLTAHHKAYISNYGKVWFSEKALTNILSMKCMVDKFPVTYNSTKERVFTVHKPDGCQV